MFRPEHFSPRQKDARALQGLDGLSERGAVGLAEDVRAVPQAGEDSSLSLPPA
ncbi:MAG: hypothetical protein GX493_05740 [Firmicutes bacterium]|nr:hypothetical protein [Bacillota bacterium]